MNKVLFSFALFLLAAFCGLNAQTVTKQADGNYVQAKIAATPKTLDDLTKNATKTEATYTTNKGEKFPVYLSASGRPFIIRTSKTSGNIYKSYLKETAQ